MAPYSVRRRVSTAPLHDATTERGNYETAFHEERVRYQILKEMKCLPLASISAYCQALNICPNLIARESDPFRFYGRRSTTSVTSAAAFDTAAAAAAATTSTAIRDAAQLLARNWLIRVNAFRERAFLPMLCASEPGGALFPHDHELFENGSLSILPADRDGRPVLLFYAAKGPNHLLTQEVKLSQLRCVFYLMTCLAQESKTFTFLRFGESMYANTGSPNAISHIYEALPIELAVFHVVYVHPPGSRRMVERTLLPSADIVSGKYLTSRQIVHIASSREQAIASLEQRGIRKRIIPSFLSGSWDLRCFSDWLQFRSNFDHCLQKKYISSSFFDVESQTGTTTNAYSACKVSIFDLQSEDQEHFILRNYARSHRFKSLVSKVLRSASISTAYANERKRYKIFREMETLQVDDSMMAYFDALEKCPQLIAKESDPVRFLRNNETDPKDAAVRLAKYWETRLQIFQQYDEAESVKLGGQGKKGGEERAFLPLTFTVSKKGALRETEAQMLSSGSCAILPPDDKGRSILFIRLTRKDEDGGNEEERRNIYFRCLLYLISCLGQKGKGKTKSVVIIVIRDCPRSPHFFQTLAGGKKRAFYSKDDALTDFLQVVPMEIASVHNVYFAHPGTATRLIRGTIEVRYLTEKRQQLHICSNSMEVLKELRKSGIQKECLPIALGGNWSFESFYRWFECRQEVENNLDSKLITDSLIVVSDEVVNDGEREHNINFVQLQQKGKESSLPAKKRLKGSGQFFTKINPLVDMPLSLPTDKLREAIHKAAEELPVDMARIYFEAVEIAPHLMQTESNPIKLLRCEAWSIPSAARRMCANWNMRKNLFKDRAFRPLLDLSGNGALTQEDIDLLRMGYIVFLRKEKNGNAVVFFNQGRGVNKDGIVTVEMRQSRLRGVFFMLTLASLESTGYVFIRYSDNHDSVGCKAGKLSGLIETLPIDLIFLHCCFVVPPDRGGAEVKYRLEDAVLPHNLNQTMGGYIANRLISHIAGSKDGLLEALKVKFGFDASSLPEIVGGQWTYTDHEEWLDERCRADRDRFRVSLPTTSASPQLEQELQETQRNCKIEANFLITKEFKYSRSRTSSASESSVRILTEKSESSILKCNLVEKQPGSALNEFNKEKIRREVSPFSPEAFASDSRAAKLDSPSQNNSEFPSMVEDAGSNAEGSTTSMKKSTHMDKAARVAERKARKRKMDLIYARERRKREKVGEGSLSKKLQFLKSQNAVLKSEGARLERLIQAAKSTIKNNISQISTKQSVESNRATDVRHLPVTNDNPKMYVSSNPDVAMQLQQRSQNEYLGTLQGPPPLCLHTAKSPLGIEPHADVTQSDRNECTAGSQVERSVKVPRQKAQDGGFDFITALRSGINDRRSELLGDNHNTGVEDITRVTKEDICRQPMTCSGQDQGTSSLFEAKYSNQVTMLESESHEKMPSSIDMLPIEYFGRSGPSSLMPNEVMPRGNTNTGSLNPVDTVASSVGFGSLNNNGANHLVQRKNVHGTTEQYPQQQAATAMASSLDLFQNKRLQIAGFCGTLRQQLNPQSSVVRGSSYPQAYSEPESPEVPSFEETFLFARQLQTMMVNNQREKTHMPRQNDDMLLDDAVRNMFCEGQNLSGMHAPPPPMEIRSTPRSTFGASQFYTINELRPNLAHQLNMTEEGTNSFQEDNLANLYNSLQSS